MKQQDYPGIVPPQHTGTEIEADASLDLNNIDEAKSFYLIVKDRLLNVNGWHTIAGTFSAKFQLVSPEGEEIDRKAEKNDYLKIDIPGPGSHAGEGYDWVLVEELKEISNEEKDSTGFRVRPTKNPFADENMTAHFYAGDASSNFIVSREGMKVIAWIIDRNIKPNEEAASLSDQLRHTAVGMGALKMFSKLQWQSLADGLIKNKRE